MIWFWHAPDSKRLNKINWSEVYIFIGIGRIGGGGLENEWVQHFKQLYEDINAKNDDKNEANKNKQINEGITITIEHIRKCNNGTKEQKNPWWRSNMQWTYQIWKRIIPREWKKVLQYHYLKKKAIKKFPSTTGHETTRKTAQKMKRQLDINLWKTA